MLTSSPLQAVSSSTITPVNLPQEQEPLSPPICESLLKAQTDVVPMSKTFTVLRAIMLFGSLLVLVYQSIVVLHLPSS